MSSDADRPSSAFAHPDRAGWVSSYRSGPLDGVVPCDVKADLRVLGKFVEHVVGQLHRMRDSQSTVRLISRRSGTWIQRVRISEPHSPVFVTRSTEPLRCLLGCHQGRATCRRLARRQLIRGRRCSRCGAAGIVLAGNPSNQTHFLKFGVPCNDGRHGGHSQA